MWSLILEGQGIVRLCPGVYAPPEKVEWALRVQEMLRADWADWEKRLTLGLPTGPVVNQMGVGSKVRLYRGDA